MSELIYRQAAINAINSWRGRFSEEYNEAIDDCENSIKELPTIQPEPKEGHWIGSDGSYICSECNGSPIDFIGTMGISFDAYIETLMSFCPTCGARMTR